MEHCPWTAQPEELLDRLGAAPDGLTAEESARRLAQYGPNELQEGPKKSGLRIFLEQFKDFLVLILIAAAAVSAVLGDAESTIVILAVITMNAILGTVQTLKAEASLASLRQLAAPTAKVLRGGRAVVVPGREIVPGDVVLLEAGDAVCADGRLLDCASLKTAEAALTGESLPVEKTAAALADEEAPLGDRADMVFSGTFVTYGRGRFLVTGTGMETEMGKIAALLKTTAKQETPLQVSLDQFGRRLSVGILILCGLIFALSVFWHGQSPLDAFLFAVALAVAAIPEALSSIVTIVLSFGTRKMAREGAIIRKLQAVEGLGSVSVICSDKTGPLTQNTMTVRPPLLRRADAHDQGRGGRDARPHGPRRGRAGAGAGGQRAVLAGGPARAGLRLPPSGPGGGHDGRRAGPHLPGPDRDDGPAA